MARGGRRPGAGRPTKERAPPTGQTYGTAEEYLEAVVAGIEPPDPIRVQAAKSLLAYQVPRKRAKAKSPPPGEMHRQNEVQTEQASREDWKLKVEEVRKRHDQ
jgi:hypothetical protein